MGVTTHVLDLSPRRGGPPRDFRVDRTRRRVIGVPDEWPFVITEPGLQNHLRGLFIFQQPTSGSLEWGALVEGREDWEDSTNTRFQAKLGAAEFRVVEINQQTMWSREHW